MLNRDRYRARLRSPALLSRNLKPLQKLELDPTNLFYDNLAGYWLINEQAGLVYDYVSNSHGSFVGDAAWGSDSGGSHIALDGLGDGIDCGTNSRTNIDTSGNLLSIISTIKTSDTDSTICAKRDGAIEEFQFFLSAGVLTFRSAATALSIGSTSVADGNEHMVGMARDHGANSITSFLDDGSDGGSTSVISSRLNVNLSIGCRWNTYPATAFELSGNVYSLAIWTGRCLDIEEYLLFRADQYQVLKARGTSVPVSSSDITITPTPASAIVSSVAPSVVRGSVTITPSPVSAIASTVAPSVIKGSVSITPAPVSAIASTVAPTVITTGSITKTPTPASAIASSVAPSVVLGSVSITPSPASAIARSVAPIVIRGSVSLTPTPASARGSALDPVVVMGSVSITPAPASAIASTIAPTVKLAVASLPTYEIMDSQLRDMTTLATTLTDITGG